MPNIQAIIFDMDGVLLDSEPLHHEALNAVLAPLGQRVDDAEYSAYIGDTSRNTWTTLAAQRALPEPVDSYMARYDDAVCTIVAAQAVPMPGLRPLLADLRAAGVPLAVGSTSPRRWIDVTLATIGIRAAFAAVVSSQEVAHGKPAPDIFLRAATLLGIAPARCLVIEDSARGLQAARAAGMFVVALQPGGSGPTAPPADLVVPSLAAFHAWWRAQSSRPAG